MDFIMVFIAGCFIALLIAVALTFGFTLLMILLASAVVAAVLTVVREQLRRWNFIRQASRNETQVDVIEGDYTDISSHDEKD